MTQMEITDRKEFINDRCPHRMSLVTPTSIGCKLCGVVLSGDEMVTVLISHRTIVYTGTAAEIVEANQKGILV